MESELTGYVKQFRFPVMDVEIEKPIDFDKELKVASISEADVQFTLGDLLFSFRRYEEAIPFFEKALALDANSVKSLVALGTIHLRKRAYAEARKSLQRAIELDKGNYLAHFQYATLRLAEGDATNAIESFKEAAKLKPEFAYLHFQLAYAYSESNRDAEAIESYTLALRADPRFKRAYFNRAFVNLRQARGNYAAADAQTYLNQAGWREDESLFMALVAYLGCKRENRAADANRALNLAITRGDSSAWPYPILQYLSGSLTESQLLGLAKDPGQLTELHTYVGLNLSVNGNTAEALTHLR
jgi:tetratricopeptide (TPR) repeat protein